MPVIRPSAGVCSIRSSSVRRGAGGDREGAVLDERAGVEQVVEVLPRRALVGLAPPRHRVGPLVVERQRAALEILGEVGPDMVEVDLLLDRGALHLDIGLLDEQQRMALVDRLAGLDRDAPHVAARRALISCSIFMASMISSGWPAATASPSFTDRLTIVPCIGAGTGTVPSGASLGASGVGRLGRRLAERQHRQRIDRIDPRAGLPAAAAAAPRPPGNSARRSAWPPRRSASSRARRRSAYGPCRRARPCRRAARAGSRCCVGAPSSRNAASARSAARQRVVEVGRAVHDHLGEQRVEAGIGAVAGIAEGVDPHARPRRRLERA